MLLRQSDGPQAPVLPDGLPDVLRCRDEKEEEGEEEGYGADEDHEELEEDEGVLHRAEGRVLVEEDREVATEVGANAVRQVVSAGLRDGGREFYEELVFRDSVADIVGFD